MSCITLLTDFGLQDATVASAKGILMQHTPLLPIVDISHQVTPHQVMQAAYLLLSAYKNFPPGTCHVVLVNVFYDKAPRMVLCEKDRHYFLAPDNGLLSLAFNETEGYSCYQWHHESTFKDWLNETGKAIEHIQVATEKNAYTPCTLQKATDRYAPKINADSAECRVIHIDHYENIIVNITREQFETAARGRNFRIEYMRGEAITTLNHSYAEVKKSERLCRFNSAGYLEIAIKDGNAAGLFGLRVYQEQHVIYNSIKIFFE
ncbi:MAG: SAM-dependent chlorinase/fluorinase [Flavipsychrobacter sp.]|nr:SAM-dependent chlorinase/fluorinase [Flavipsychrobacter sp.]